MSPMEFRALCADKVANMRYIRFTEQQYVICTINALNGSVVVGSGENEAEAQRNAMSKMYEHERYLLKEREYESGLGILGIRFKSDPPYEVQPDTPES